MLVYGFAPDKRLSGPRNHSKGRRLSSWSLYTCKGKNQNSLLYFLSFQLVYTIRVISVSTLAKQCLLMLTVSAMDRKEKLELALNGELKEGVLCGFWHHFGEDQLHGASAVKAHLDFYQATQPDMLKVMNEHMFKINEHIEKPDDWRKISRIPFHKGPYPAFLDEFKAIRKALPPDLPLFATVHGVMVSAYHATEIPGFFSNPDNMVSRHLREDPESVTTGLDVISDTLIELCEKLAEAGADGIYYAALGGEEHRFSETLFVNYVKRQDKKVIDAINSLGLISVLHICKEKIRLPLYSGINADIVNWAVHDCPYSLKDGRKHFPGKTLLGGFDDRTGILVEGTKEEITAETDRIIEEAGKERLIIGADCTLPGGIEYWRIKTVQDRAHSYR